MSIITKKQAIESRGILFRNQNEYNEYLNHYFKVVYNNCGTENLKDNEISMALRLADLIGIGETHNNAYRRIHCPVIAFSLTPRNVTFLSESMLSTTAILVESSSAKQFKKTKLPRQIQYLNPEALDRVFIGGWDDPDVRSGLKETINLAESTYIAHMKTIYEQMEENHNSLLSTIKKFIYDLKELKNSSPEMYEKYCERAIELFKIVLKFTNCSTQKLVNMSSDDYKIYQNLYNLACYEAAFNPEKYTKRTFNLAQTTKVALEFHNRVIWVGGRIHIDSSDTEVPIHQKCLKELYKIFSKDYKVLILVPKNKLEEPLEEETCETLIPFKISFIKNRIEQEKLKALFQEDTSASVIINKIMTYISSTE